MSFNSMEFAIFLPTVFLFYWVLPHRFRWLLLLAASYLFYCWWDFGAGFLLISATLVSWLCAQGIHRAERLRARKLYLCLALAVCLGCLGIFKYAGFFASLAGLDLPLKILLPVGISFYTFQALSYVLDVYRGDTAPENHFGYYALFVSFFPQLVAGPIERSERLLPQLKQRRQFREVDFAAAGQLLLTGYFKKLVVADYLAPWVDQVYAAPDAATALEILIATVLFGFQIYCDFSGYSDIARGASKLLGIDLMENFRLPYSAASIRDFWRRWHISLTGWFTDYVYIPLGGSWKGLLCQIRNVLIVFLLSGLWHGADWTYVIWGGIHGCYLILELLCRRHAVEKQETSISGHILTFSLVNFAWLFFRADSLSDAGALLSGLLTRWQLPMNLMSLTPDGILRIALSLFCLHLIERRTIAEKSGTAVQAVFYLVTVIGIGGLLLMAASGQNAFIYFQF